MSAIAEKLEEKGLALPNAAAPAANYVPYVITGKTVHIAGQLPFINGQQQYIGKLGADASIEDAYEGARCCFLNILAQINAAVDGDLSRVKRLVKLGGFVNSTDDFNDHPKVVNGASDLAVEIFGDAGRHARFAVGAASLPFGVMVEIDAIFEIE